MAPKYWSVIGMDIHGNKVFVPVGGAVRPATRSPVVAAAIADEASWSMYHGCIVYMGTFVLFYGQVFFEYYKYTYIYICIYS